MSPFISGISLLFFYSDIIVVIVVILISLLLLLFITYNNSILHGAGQMHHNGPHATVHCALHYILTRITHKPSHQPGSVCSYQQYHHLLGLIFYIFPILLSIILSFFIIYILNFAKYSHLLQSYGNNNWCNQGPS